jgi:beta-lactam-binding protein with PASTA domain
MKIMEWIKEFWWAKLITALIIIIIITLLIDRIIMPLYVGLGNETELPDVIEMPLADAQALLGEKGFQVVVNDSLFDAIHPVAMVIEQNPYPYATVKTGRRVYLTVSIGEKPILMPNLFGVSPREAELILDTYDLVLGSKSYVYSDLYYEGTVMGQSYPSGQEIKSHSKIDIIISLGQLNKELIVPDMIGKSLHEARERLKALNLQISEIIWEERDNILPETVISQSIAPGMSFEPQETISLVVSKEKGTDPDREGSSNE